MTPREEWQLDTRHLGRRVLVFDSLDSTSTYAASLAADPANAGVVVLADEQSAGRGQHGRTWQCQARQGILTSLLLFPPPELRRPAILTAWAAVAVCETIRRATDLDATIKWPNDVLIQGRKVCGILIEQGRGTVVGIGLNVHQTAESFAAAGLTEAGSLAVFSGRPLDRYALAGQLIAELDAGYAVLCDGELHTLETRWKARLGLLGKRVVAECSAGNHCGLLVEVGFSGVELEETEGRRMHLAPEVVRRIFMNEPQA